MTTKVYTKSYPRKVVNRFERAVENYAFRGTIPAGESEAAAQAYDNVVNEYKGAKKALLSMIDRLGIS